MNLLKIIEKSTYFYHVSPHSDLNFWPTYIT